jgi:hypothetical protein
VRRARGIEAIRRLLKKVLSDCHAGELRGCLRHRTKVITKVTGYLRALKTCSPKELPASLREDVFEYRRQAADTTLHADIRLSAIEFLVTNQTDITLAVKETPTQARWRAGVRRQALLDITECFKADRIHWASLDDVALRLPETAAPKPEAPKAVMNTAALEEALAVLRRNKQ